MCMRRAGKADYLVERARGLGDFFGVLGIAVKQIGLEAGPLSA
jgi:hypothetical protein